MSLRRTACQQLLPLLIRIGQLGSVQYRYNVAGDQALAQSPAAVCPSALLPFCPELSRPRPD